jgi:lipopolysaccharide transport system ATP-binding protein
MSTVIKVENLGKLYRLGEVGTGTLSHDLNRWWAKLRGKEDPFAKVGEANDRTKKGVSDYVWALNDINFEVEKGQVVGIIGKNGAGKSTLLKILSKVTKPTKGNVSIRGRIASLLEVGTGFHPELTGRENIYLNGAILGMTKQEIRSKFDAIVDFSGVERYIDTPVKRYSSGMYVRLAFAVAAYLEPEILIVDEVLAVGDAEFQKKCLGRMQEVSVNDGRTILFVSHQLGMVRALCNKGLVISNGNIVFNGTSGSAIDYYVNNALEKNTDAVRVFTESPGLNAQILSCRLTNRKNENGMRFDVFDEIYLHVTYVVRKPISGMNICYVLDKNAETLGYSFDTDFNESLLGQREPGTYTFRVRLPYPLKAGIYQVSTLSLGIVNLGGFNVEKDVLSFEVVEESFDPTYKSFSSNRDSMLVFSNEWEQLSYERQ